MQQKSECFGEFTARTDRLAAHLGITVSELTGVVRLSNGMLFAYRKGKHPISPKAWSKLEAAERAAGLPMPDQLPAKPQELDVLPGLTMSQLWAMLPEDARDRVALKLVDHAISVWGEHSQADSALGEAIVDAFKTDASPESTARLRDRAQALRAQQAKAERAHAILTEAGFQVPKPRTDKEIYMELRDIMIGPASDAATKLAELKRRAAEGEAQRPPDEGRGRAAS